MKNTENFLNKLQDSLKKKADEYEIFYVNIQETPVLFECDKLKSINSRFSCGTGIRVVKNNKIGFSSLSSEKEEYIERLIENAISSSKFGLKKNFEFPSRKKIPQVPIYDKKIFDLEIKKMIGYGSKTVEIIKNSIPRVRTSIQIEKSIIFTRIINSAGFDKSYKKSVFAFYVTGILVQKNGLLEVSEEYISCCLGLNLEKIVDKILKKINLAKRTGFISTKKMPVIFSPRATLSIITSLQRMINGKFIQKNSSPLTGKIGEKIFDKRVTIYDDGTLNYALNTSPVDDEGSVKFKFPIVEGGVLKNFVFDLQTAGMLNTETTASAARGITSPPFPDTSNIVIETGKDSLEEIIKDVKEGLLVEQTMGAHQANLLAGEFSFNVDLGFKIEKGEITGRVKDVMVTGNIFEAFNQIIAISKEREMVFGNFLSPYFYVDKINVSSK